MTEAVAVLIVAPALLGVVLGVVFERVCRKEKK